MKKTIFQTLLIILLSYSLTAFGAVAEKKPKKIKGKPKTEVADSTKTKSPVSITSFFKKEPVKTQKGIISIHFSKDRYYFEVPDSVLNQDLLVVGRISKGAAGARASMIGYSGDHISTNMIRFEKGVNNKIHIRRILVREMSKDSTQAMYESVMRSNLQAILASFEIKSYSADSSSFLIDVTDFFNEDNEFLFFSKNVKKALGLQKMHPDKSFVNKMSVYPENVEVSVTKTYSTESGTAPYTISGMATFELNASIIQLPKNLMTARYFDPRVGYFATGYYDYDQHPQGVEMVRMITRWRLEPKPEDMEKYKAGELVEPQKQIVYYIDPSTPEKWVPYLMQGVDDWEPVFRKAGFKNAIVAKRAPTFEEDSTWSLEDARYSAIVYKPSTIPNASGPHVGDPRTGEILESHVNWYHNVMSLLHDWYFIQCGAVDTGAQKMIFDDELMGQLIRFVSSHEIGHTLGLRHNFAATYAYPVEKLRDREFLKEHGHTASIMDYSRFNFVAQPEDKIERELLFPRIGEYDNWVIEWGYRRFPEIDNPIKELPKLNEWTIERTKNPLCWFGRENNPDDPRCQSEDLGNNQMEANTYAIKNLKIITKNLTAWTKEENEGYSNLATMYSQVETQFLRYALHCSKWIGGIYENPKTVEEEGVVYEFVEKSKQKEAFKYLNDNVFITPEWLLAPEIYALINTDGQKTMNRIHNSVMNAIVNPRVMRNLINAENTLGNKAYTLTEFFNDLDNAILKESGGKASLYKRNLQRAYVDALLKCVIQFGKPKPATPGILTISTSDYSDASSFAIYQLKNLQKRFQNATSSDPLTKAHYLYLVEYIKSNLEN